MGLKHSITCAIKFNYMMMYAEKNQTMLNKNENEIILNVPTEVYCHQISKPV